MIEVIPLKYGVTFKRVFSKPEIFREFVHDVTGVEVHVDQVFTEYEYPERIGNVQIKYDLFTEDIEQRIVIEIQHVKEEDFFYGTCCRRFLYYHLISIIEQVASYEEYATPKAVYTIVVLTSVPRDGSINYSWGQNLMNLLTEHNEIVEIAPHRLIFLNPRLQNEKTPKAVQPWLELIEDSLDRQVDERNYTSSTLQQIIQDIRRKTVSPEELADIMDEAAWEKAKTRFREEGREEGQKAQKIEIARQLLDVLEDQVIAEKTGLTLEEIQVLRDSR